jgi:hypothetical protein
MCELSILFSDRDDKDSCYRGGEVRNRQQRNVWNGPVRLSAVETPVVGNAGAVFLQRRLELVAANVTQRLQDWSLH